MKKIFLIIFGAICLTAILKAQPGANKLIEIKLDNGLTILLNEDHSIPNILGAVVIKTGAKYDPPNATGTSHYLEHMLFKGTDKLGTIDYKSEREYLNKIFKLYDKLGRTEDQEDREMIQKNINKVSLKAGKYAIPNELDKILDEIGSTMVNAFTSDEVVGYLNFFPNNQIEKWLAIYSHRFQNPVFRLFQSELETVFEEKNMYDDNFITTVIESFFENFYKNHPYGQQTILGSSEHIRNPSLSIMQEMYETYYVANNMALILTGNFNSKEVIPMIEKYFGVWKKANVPTFKEYPEKPFNGVERVKERLTPVRVGVMGFRTVPQNHPDQIALEVCLNILTNNYSTGYLDQLSIENKLMEVSALHDVRNDHGGMMFIYVPKLIFQSFNRAERHVHEQILRLKNRDIDKDLLESVKLSMIKDHQKSFEDVFQRAFLIAETFYTDKSWKDVVTYPEKVNSITAEDIQKVADKYLNRDYLSFQSRMGFPKNERLEKPGYDPIEPENKDAVSEFGKEVSAMHEKEVRPDFIHIDRDVFVERHDKNHYNKLFYVHNDINDIFNVKIKFHGGNYHDNRYPYLAQYMKLIGSQKLSLEELNSQLQQIACDLNVYSNDEYFVIEINGFDKHLNTALELISELLSNPAADRSKRKNLRQMARFERRFESRSPDDVARALLNYGVYGENSPTLRRMTTREVRKMGCDELLKLLAETIQLPYSIHYSGSLKQKEVSVIFRKNLGLITGEHRHKIPVEIQRSKISENTILFLDDSKSIQSRIYFHVEGEKSNIKDRATINAFNRYFGSGMSSLIFQEIRELRSLAYAAYGRYRLGNSKNENGYLQVFVGTHADKTLEAVETVHNMIVDMPKYDNRMKQIQTSLLQSINSSKPNNREMSEAVENWLKWNIKEDPRMFEYEQYNGMSFHNIIKFYRKNIAKKPILITISGNSDNIDMEKLGKYGNIIHVDKKDIFN